MHVPARLFTLLGIWFDVMVLKEMLSKMILVVCEPTTFRSVLLQLAASPHFRKEVLRVLVTFPVVATAKFLVALSKCAPIRTGMTLHVLPAGSISTNGSRFSTHGLTEDRILYS